MQARTVWSFKKQANLSSQAKALSNCCFMKQVLGSGEAMEVPNENNSPRKCSSSCWHDRKDSCPVEQNEHILLTDRECWWLAHSKHHPGCSSEPPHTLAGSAIPREARQTGAGVGGATHIDALGPLGDITVVETSFTVVDGPLVHVSLRTKKWTHAFGRKSQNR